MTIINSSCNANRLSILCVLCSLPILGPFPFAYEPTRFDSIGFDGELTETSKGAQPVCPARGFACLTSRHRSTGAELYLLSLLNH